MIDLPRALGPPTLRAEIRRRPEDFFVDEQLGFAADGEGEHLLVRIEKRNMNTLFAVKLLAAWADIGTEDIGFAGLKDRHAVTRQSFTIRSPRRIAPEPSAMKEADLQILDMQWHRRKLQRGALRGNRFRIMLSSVEGEHESIEQRLAQIRERGVPNGFGEQRFGRNGGNVTAALSMFAGRRVGREKRALLLSAARSELFNRVLAERIRRNRWDAPLSGEVWMLAGSHSVFGPESTSMSETLMARLSAFDIHPTGPMWGRGELRCTDECRDLEQKILGDDQSRVLCMGLERAGIKQERRALRMMPDALQWRWLTSDQLELSFGLPAGSYATVLLRELGDIVDVSPLCESGGDSVSA